jgi:hypothetical protein
VLNQPFTIFLPSSNKNFRKFPFQKISDMKKIACLVNSILISAFVFAQIDAGLFRFPDVSKDQ